MNLLIKTKKNYAQKQDTKLKKFSLTAQRGRNREEKTDSLILQ